MIKLLLLLFSGLKLGKILLSGGSMLLALGVYAMLYGWRYAAGFIALLFLTSASGLALWLAAGTTLLTAMLCLHLGAVMALFATLPYGKFAHGIYRSAALLRNAVEKRLPNPVGLGSD